MWIDDWLGKSLMLGKIEDRKRRGHQRLKWLDSITVSMNMNLANSGRWGGMWRPGELQFMGLQSRTWLGNRTMMCVCRVGRRAGLKLHLDKRQFYSIFQKNVRSVLTTKWFLLPSPCLVFFIFTELSLIYFGFINHARNVSSITLTFPSFYLSWQLPSKWY